MNLPPSVYGSIGAIAAAMIAGAISFLIAVLSKEQKTSEFRQCWIDGLRADLAELAATFSLLTSYIRLLAKQGKNFDQILEALSQNQDKIAKFELAEARVKLRLNPTEHVALLKKMTALHDYAGSEKLMDSDAGDACLNNLVQESQTVLKTEWKRVKRGETVYVVTKYVSLAVMLVAALVIGLLARGHIHFN